ncbi:MULTISPECIES: metallophosphoesterase family protein [unclassified Marinobacter]|uniref:metallophosphoesterase family protein n=1 Tax=unclassified Marinobacter TaxID=83889 RepID=UPI001926AEA7|nr:MULTISPECIES: metallophosphoesterase family protein [unclassified Marinobacter]MBL3826580.1 metallophosphoesterase family protein [Marinobacter sp. MC3]MBL3895211.1 metallophosphoesterase family protein [Marinobacter sp. MW3]
MQIGVIADTHSKMRPEALEVLKGSDLILHAGDVGRDEVLDALEAIAPVVAIRGNIDKAGRAATLPDIEDLEFLGHAFYMLHDVKTLDMDPQGRYRAVIAGHSHKPRNEWVGDVLYFNPGGAGPRRFTLPITVGRLQVSEDGVVGEIIELPV